MILKYREGGRTVGSGRVATLRRGFPTRKCGGRTVGSGRVATVIE